MERVKVIHGTPDARRVLPLSGPIGMGLAATFSVPPEVRQQGAAAALAFVQAQLLKACAAVPELSFSVVVGEPDL